MTTRNLGKHGSLISHQETITPIPSSGEEEYNYQIMDSHNNVNDSLSETNIEQQNQKELNQNLRILERQRGIEQLVTSEDKYCNNLKKLITLYLEPLSAHLSSQNQFILFGDIKRIYDKNAQFSVALEQKYKTFEPSRTLLGDAFIKFFNPNLRSLYQNYVNRHEEASKLLSSLHNDSKFMKVCSEALTKSKKSTQDDNDVTNHLKHLLLLPIHRIGKYESMVKDILNYTNNTHSDYTNLSQCVRDMTSINQLISEKMREFSEREVVRKIANAIKGNESFQLVTPYRKFIKNGYLIKMGKTKPQRYLFFLFNDLLFYCKAVGSDKDIHSSTDKEREDSNSKSKSEEIKEENGKVSINLRTASEDTAFGLTSTVAHDYSDTSDLHQITSLFGGVNKQRGKSRKSRTKLFNDPGSDEFDELSMTSFGMNVDIHNEIDVFNTKNIGQFKVHNLMPIDAAFQVCDFRIFPQRYDHKAFEIRSSVKSFIVVAETDKSKKEWMTLLEHCTNHLKLNGLSLMGSNAMSSSPNKKTFAATLYLPTNFTEQCMKCGKQFGYSRRKNHCHHCGLLVCSKCLTEKLPSFQNSIKAGQSANKSKNNTTFKVCDDCYTKNKHFFPEFEEANLKIFAYKQKSKRKQKKTKKGKKSKFKIFGHKSGLTEGAENDDFYEKGSLKDGPPKKSETSNAFNEHDSDGSDDSDYEQLSENEPSMLSIPENDDHIETLIGHNDIEASVSSHLAPHWTPHATSGIHNRDFSHNLHDNGYADNDSDSDDLQATNALLSPKDTKRLSDDLTPPVSDADVPLSPYYDDTPLMNQHSESVSPILSPRDPHTNTRVKLEPQNSLNMGNVLDEIEREQQERIEADEAFADNDNDEEDTSMGKKQETAAGNRQSKLLRAIPEYEDTDDDTSANDTDAQTAYEHIRNLSTHIEDQEYMILQSGDVEEHSSGDEHKPNQTANFDMRNSLKINIQRNGSHDEPGNTPPPVSPRYKKMSQNHKRKLSNKLDRFLTERQGPQQLIQKHILYATPEEDIETLKEKIQIKREERDKIKKRLKRKLSHDFRPTEQDIEERGIKIVPEVIRSDEEDGDEEFIVYTNSDDRNSFSLRKKRRKSMEKTEYASVLQNERKRKSLKLKQALMDRPSPSDIIETGYISAENVNSNIPPLGAQGLIKRLKAELAVAIGENYKYKVEKRKSENRMRRRQKILTFYDAYLFNYIFDDEDDGFNYPLTEQYVDIDRDYGQILEYVKNDVSVNSDESSLEKEWMRNLRKRRFKTYINAQKCKMLQMKREAIETQLNELTQQIEFVQNTKSIDRMSNEVNWLEQQRLVLIEKTSQQIDALRDIIKKLNTLHDGTSFISVS